MESTITETAPAEHQVFNRVVEWMRGLPVESKLSALLLWDMLSNEDSLPGNGISNKLSQEFRAEIETADLSGELAEIRGFCSASFLLSA